ncbi:MAG: hypothetical protein JSV91_09970 [Phycisphaerales bacterium]|nr:MAG: hypothetical protein JSV91_09970 [Phycisphaerales bacterium]
MERTPRPRLRPEADRSGQPPRPPRRFRIGWLTSPPMRYPNAYLWFLFFSAMDVMLTWKILEKDGTEVNPVARMLIDHWSGRGEDWALWSTIGFKFCLMLFVIVVCEAVGRKKDRTGRWLAWISVGISALPVVYSLGLLTYHVFVLEPMMAE